MAKTKLELCRDLDGIIKEIDKGIEGLPERTSSIIRKRLVESVYETDKPDAYYPTRNRIINGNTICLYCEPNNTSEIDPKTV